MAIKIKIDEKNNNTHTDSGISLLKKSVESVGVIEAITISNDDKIISGNARFMVMQDSNLKEPIVFETDGSVPVIIKRKDIESDTKKFYEASILANTTAKENINIDMTVVRGLQKEYGIEYSSVGISAERMKNNSNFHNKTEDSSISSADLFPITVLQSKEEYELFNSLKERLKINSTMKCFTEIIKIADKYVN